MKYQSDNTSHVLSAIDDARQSFFTLEKSGVNNYFKKLNLINSKLPTTNFELFIDLLKKINLIQIL